MLLALLAAGPVVAQEAIPTNTHSPQLETPVAPGGPLLVPDRPPPDPVGPALVGPCGEVAISEDGSPPPPDTTPHGQVFAGVGTSGYREAGGYVCQPLKNGGAVSIAVDAGRINTPAGVYYPQR
jgi:hypothetical protein